MNIAYSVVAAKIPKSQAPKQPASATAPRWPPQLAPLPSKSKPPKVQPANKLMSGIQSINQPSTVETPTSYQPTRGERGVAEISYLLNNIFSHWQHQWNCTSEKQPHKKSHQYTTWNRNMENSSAAAANHQTKRGYTTNPRNHLWTSINPNTLANPNKRARKHCSKDKLPEDQEMVNNNN